MNLFTRTPLILESTNAHLTFLTSFIICRASQSLGI
jgi:hypothetical protein